MLKYIMISEEIIDYAPNYVYVAVNLAVVHACSLFPIGNAFCNAA